MKETPDPKEGSSALAHRQVQESSPQIAEMREHKV